LTKPPAPAEGVGEEDIALPDELGGSGEERLEVTLQNVFEHAGGDGSPGVLVIA